MTSIINAASGGVTFTGGTTAELAIQAGGSTAAAFNTNGLFFRNRIINGDMRIDQRNAGASGTGNAPNYTVDRWAYNSSQTNKLTWQQNAGSVTPPAGFTNYLGVTSSSAYTLTGNDYFNIYQIIEGNNVADLAWGTADARPATLSFWVRSSLTGTFGGSIATTKTAVWELLFTYSISSANTWTYITVSIPAATSTGGTNTDNSAGVYVRFGLGSVGVSAGGTAGTWVQSNFIQPANTVSVVSTNAATWYITGVQLETGSTATPFERRPYGTELILCQRYYFRTTSDDTAYMFGGAYADSATRGFAYGSFPVTMRVAPSAIEQNGTAANYIIRSGGADRACSVVPVFNSATTQYAWQVETTVASGQTAGQAGYFYAGVSGAYLGWSAEL